MNKDRMLNVLKQVLLVFVFITIGYGIGKEVTLRRVQVATSVTGTAPGDQVVVYYAHATIRCVTCETMERLTHETLDEQFSDAMAAGTLVFKDVDFQQDAAFAKEYEVVANCVIVNRVEHSRNIKHQMLDQIWELYQDPPAFKRYLGDAIRTYLDALPGGAL